MNDLIADVLKNYKDVDQDNIEDVLISFSMRGVSVDRCSHLYWLELYDADVGKATSFQSNSFSRSPNKIPNYVSFHKLAYTYLSSFRIVYRDAEDKTECADGCFIGHSTWDVAAAFNRPNLQLIDIPTCKFLRPQSTDKHIEEFAHNHIDSMNTPIELCSASSWVLRKLKRKLNDAGFNSVRIVQSTIDLTMIQKVKSMLYQLRRRFALLDSVGKLIWAAIGAAAVSAIGWVVTKFLELAWKYLQAL